MWLVLHIRHRQKKSVAELVCQHSTCSARQHFPEEGKTPKNYFRAESASGFFKSVVLTGDRTTRWKEIKIQTLSSPASATHTEQLSGLFGNGKRADLPVASELLPVASWIIFSSELLVLSFQAGKSE